MSDDDDMGEYWRDVKAARQQKRADNREASPKLLAAAGIEFETKNMGAHLIVKTPAGFIDFWPGTGLWTNRRNNKSRRGVQNLIRYVKELP